MAPKAMAPSANPITDSMKAHYDSYKDWIIKSAAVMAEKDYSFHPATMPAPDKAEIRTFGAIISHLAQENPVICAQATGMAAPANTDMVGKMTTKADLTKAIGEAFAFCDRAWASTNDTNAGTPMDLPFGLGKSTRLGVLMFNAAHNAEHYGNLVTYLRAKGIVPPSSVPAK
jgi:uncharacterized damage-inducible protein DinB